MRRAICISLGSSWLLSGCGNHPIATSPHAASAPIRTISTSAASAPRYANRLVIRYKASASSSAIRSLHQRFSLTSQREIGTLALGVLALPSQLTAEAAIGKLQGHPAVDFVEPDYLYSLPNRPATRRAASIRRSLSAVGASALSPFGDLWGLGKISLPAVWNAHSGHPAVTVAVIDTGVDAMHPDLAGTIVPGTSLIGGSTGPQDDHGHGTHVAGVIAANRMDGRGVYGVAPACRIMPVKVLNHEGKGDTGDIVAGLIWAVNHGAKVVNMSLGGTGGSRALMEAVRYAQSKDVLVVAAMGNEGENAQEYPAGYPGVMAVGATDDADRLADFSNYGSWISVAAPGVAILSTLPTQTVSVNRNEGKSRNQDLMDGTSMAAPFVAGLAALVRSAYPQLTAPQVKVRIERSADDLGAKGFDERFGWGRINAQKALAP
ncbi:MAG: S8 family peptidase [Candidatus Sericytochromatia bacterium]|nr:S8 family peptidase [Candidatus Sericytochromatia bacterium]